MNFEENMACQLNSLALLAEICHQVAVEGVAGKSEEVVDTSVTSTASTIGNLSTNNQPVSSCSYTSIVPEFTNHAKNILRQWSKDNDNNLNPDQDTVRKLARLTSLTYDQVSTWFYNKRHRNSTNASRYFPPENVEVLEAFFRQNRYPSRNDKVLLATQLCITVKQVNAWFYNRRLLYNPKSEDEFSLTYGPLTHAQIKQLEIWVNENNENISPSQSKICELAQLIGTSFVRVYQWFYTQRRRATKNITSRRRISEISLETLEDSFKSNKYPDRATKERLPTTLDKSIKYVSTWFSQRRRKENQSKLL